MIGFQPHPHPILQRGLENELINDHASVMKPPEDSLYYLVWRASKLVNTSIYLESGASQPTGTEAPVIRTVPDLTLLHVSLHLAALLCLLFIFIYF